MSLTRLVLCEVFDQLADTMTNIQSLVAELGAVLDKASSSRGSAILQQVTKLFLRDAGSCSDDQITVFGVVINVLIEKAERKTLIELSGSFATADHAPVDVIRRLSRDDDIAISGPILEKSSLLSDGDILEVAAAKGKELLLAIASRNPVSETITDALINRAIPEVVRRLTDNKHARFSELGFAKLISQAKNDGDLVASISIRKDISAELRSLFNQALA